MWTGIELLYPLQELRADIPILEDFFVIISSRLFYLVLPIMIVLAFYWLIDKRKGEALGLGCISAAAFAMSIKNIIAEPRPWKIDPEIEYVPGANSNGYSCPSGHTTMVTSSLIPAALISKKRILSVILIVLAVLIITARLVLCAHTPLDVIVGSLIGLSSTFIAFKAVDFGNKDENGLIIVTSLYLIVLSGLILYVLTLDTAEMENVLDYAGFFYGIVLGRYLEHKTVGFESLTLQLRESIAVYLMGVLVAGAILGIPMLLIPAAGTFIGGFLMMVWCFFIYPMILVRKTEAVRFIVTKSIQK